MTKKLKIYCDGFIELVTDTCNRSVERLQNAKQKAKNSESSKDLSNKSKFDTSNVARVMKKWKEILLASAAGAVKNGVAYFVTVSLRLDIAEDKEDYELSLKSFLQRLRRLLKKKSNSELNFVLVKEHGKTIGYHAHMVVWFETEENSLTIDEIKSQWKHGASTAKKIETIEDLNKVANYCFNYSTKKNPDSAEKIEEKRNGLKYFSPNESLVKHSKRLKKPEVIEVSIDFELDSKWKLISSSYRDFCSNGYVESHFYEFEESVKKKEDSK